MSERATYILPRDKGAAPLDFVIAVITFLAALALGASLVATRAAYGWQSGLSDRITVQIMPPEQGSDPRDSLETETKIVLRVLNATPGIAHATLLSDAEINALVEPWIGKDGVVAGIPIRCAQRRSRSRRAPTASRRISARTAGTSSMTTSHG